MFLKYVYLVLLCLVLKLNIAQVYFNNRYDTFGSCDGAALLDTFNNKYFTAGFTCTSVSYYALNLRLYNIDGSVSKNKTYQWQGNNFINGKGFTKNSNRYLLSGARFYHNDTSLVFQWIFDSNLDSVKYVEYGYLNQGNIIFDILDYQQKNYFMVGQVYDSQYNSDILLIKTDTSGNEIWKKKIGLPNYDETAWCIKTSSDGKLLISGNRRLHNNQSTNGAFVIKADTSGAIIWEKYFPSNYGLAATGMVELSNGDIVAIAGKGFGSNISRYELIKLDAAGNILFDKVYGPMADRAEVYSLIQNQEGNLVAAGQIYYSANNSVNGLMYVFNQYGDSLFSREYAVESGSQNYFRDLVQAPDKGYVFSGFISPIFANGGTGNQDIWLLKTDSTFCESAFNCGYPTGIAEVEVLEAGEMSLVPNPTNGLLTISTSNDFEKIELTNITGQVLLSEMVNSHTYQLQLQNFAEGIYFVKVSYADGRSYTKKVIKQ